MSLNKSDLLITLVGVIYVFLLAISEFDFFDLKLNKSLINRFGITYFLLILINNSVKFLIARRSQSHGFKLKKASPSKPGWTPLKPSSNRPKPPPKTNASRSSKT